jgi:tRNA(Ile)-lysidine synthetase-like protein
MVGSRRLSELTDRVLQAVRKGLESDQSPLVVALSGGADSAVLAWATRELDIGARAVHVNHGWPASDRMAEASRAIASVLQLDYEVVVVDTTGPGSSEAVARTARYRALEEVRAPEELVATAHTLTDQGETVVGNLMWGTGLDGLAGIHPRRGSVIRPLLAVTRPRAPGRRAAGRDHRLGSDRAGGRCSPDSEWSASDPAPSARSARRPKSITGDQRWTTRQSCRRRVGSLHLA